MSNTNGLNLNHSILQNILFKSVPSKSSILIHSIEAYNLARDQYYLDTPMARNEIPLRLTTSGYSELYQKGNITDHMGHILGYDTGEHRIIRFDEANVRLIQFGFNLNKIIDQQYLSLELKFLAGSNVTEDDIRAGTHLLNEQVSFRKINRSNLELYDDPPVDLKVNDVLSPSEAAEQRRRCQWISDQVIGGSFLTAEVEMRKRMLFGALGWPAVADINFDTVLLQQHTEIGTRDGVVHIDQLHFILLALNVLMTARPTPETFVDPNDRLYPSFVALLSSNIQSLYVPPLRVSPEGNNTLSQNAKNCDQSNGTLCVSDSHPRLNLSLSSLTVESSPAWYDTEESPDDLKNRVRGLAVYLLYADSLRHVQCMNDTFGGPLQCSHPLQLKRFDLLQAYLNKDTEGTRLEVQNLFHTVVTKSSPSGQSTSNQAI